jgi:hypothetical protein
MTTAPSAVEAFGWDVDSAAPGTGFEICSASCQAGTFGPGAGQLTSPFDLELDCRGAIWVADAEWNRIQRFGEPGTALPPSCADLTPPPPANLFTFGKIKKDKRIGTAILPVRVPGGGTVLLKGFGVRRSVKHPKGARTVRLLIRARGKITLGRLNRRGKALVRARVTFIPKGGTPRTRRKNIWLVKRRRH